MFVQQRKGGHLRQQDYRQKVLTYELYGVLQIFLDTAEASAGYPLVGSIRHNSGWDVQICLHLSSIEVIFVPTRVNNSQNCVLGTHQSCRCDQQSSSDRCPSSVN
eukprot:753305-Amphidinium_carterae.1